MHQDRFDTFRVVVMHPDRKHILVSGEQFGFNLPTLDIPQGARQAEAITTQLRVLAGLDSYCLFVLPEERSRGTGAGYAVTFVPRIGLLASEGFDWVAFASLPSEAFCQAGDWFAVKRAFEQIESYEQNRRKGFFGCPGWLAEITNWAQHVIARSGRKLTGAYQQLNASPSACLLRLPTNDSALWFKAAPGPVAGERRITRYLTQQFPSFLPELIAERDDCDGWLGEEVSGVHPDDRSPGATWICAATALAELQVASIGHARQLSAIGCRDVRAGALLAIVDPFFTAMASLMEEQPKPSPPRLTPTELGDLKDILLEALARVEKLNIPLTLGHLDLNTGNILVGRDRVVFLDWAAGCIGNPFLSFAYLLEQLRVLRPAEQLLAEQVQAAYTHRWRGLVGKAEMSAALAANPLLAAFSYAAGSESWRDPERLGEPDTAGHLRSLARRMKREADHWVYDSGIHSSCSGRGGAK